MDDQLADEVRRRARHRCEYCQMPQAYYPTVPFPIDHVVAKQHGGSASLVNLALSCLHCNSHKGPNIAGVDPRTQRLTRLFNPRRHKWSRHFRWRGSYLEGITPVGRTTIRVLAMNDAAAVEVREELMSQGLLPLSSS